MKFEIIFSDGRTKTTYGNLLISVPNTFLGRGGTHLTSLKTIETTDPDLKFQGYDESQAYMGESQYRIYYATGQSKVTKPLYIIDGYDPNDKRKIESKDPGHTSIRSIRELMSYDHDNDNNLRTPNKDLVQQLCDMGFDVVIANHHKFKRGSKIIDGGSDYIERNAFNFISLLNHIKSIQQGNEKAVVIGPSMGGLISRYALAYMEKRYAPSKLEKWNHNTRLWVSFDSPHQGANIPIGVQNAIDYLANDLGIEGAKKFVNEELDKPDAFLPFIINLFRPRKTILNDIEHVYCTLTITDALSGISLYTDQFYSRSHRDDILVGALLQPGLYNVNLSYKRENVSKKLIVQ